MTIYAHEGALYEVFAAADIDFAPEEGQPIAALEGKPVRFTQCCTPDGMSDMVLSGLGIAKE